MPRYVQIRHFTYWSPEILTYIHMDTILVKKSIIITKIHDLLGDLRLISELQSQH